MKVRYYCVKDITAKEFGPLFAAKNDGVACRQFKNLVINDRVVDPSEYELYFVGDFDSDIGVFTAPSIPISVESGSAYKEVIK